MGKIGTILIGLVILFWDYYLFMGWRWILEHGACYIPNMTKEDYAYVICWDNNILMTVCITLLSIGVTLYYSYQIFHMMFIFKK
jgi:hypothetical protein